MYVVYPNPEPPRERSKSGDSSTLSKLLNKGDTGDTSNTGEMNHTPSEEANGAGVGVVKDVPKSKEGKKPSVHFGLFNGHTDIGNLHRTLKMEGSLNKRKSLSSEDLSLTSLQCRDSPDRMTMPDEEPDFTVLSYLEPDDLDTGGAFTVIFDECDDLYLSDEDCVDDRSEEIKDLIPMDSCQTSADGIESSRRSISVTPPRATLVLINAFLQRLESIIINIVDYPPGLFFVQ